MIPPVLLPFATASAEGEIIAKIVETILIVELICAVLVIIALSCTTHHYDQDEHDDIDIE